MMLFLALALLADDPEKLRVEVTGCVKGSVLTETNLRLAEDANEAKPSLRWRLRGPKALMKQLKQHSAEELQIIGTTKAHDRRTMVGGARIGNSGVYIGAQPNPAARDPLPEQPTIDVLSFEPTGVACVKK